MKTIKAYTASELKKKNPEGFESAHEKFVNQEAEYSPAWANETIKSLKAVYTASGITLRDYSIRWDYPRQSWVKIEFNGDHEAVKDLTGTRAQAWLENNLLAGLRIGYHDRDRWELAKYGKYYRAGMIKPCPFTGYCFDDALLDSLEKDIKAGETLGESFENLVEVTGKAIESEWEYQQTEEYFINHADANGYLFTREGVRVD